MKYEILRLEHITLTNGGGHVLNGLTLSLHEGEILCIATTNHNASNGIANVLSGNCGIDSGALYYHDKRVDFSSKAEARNAGIFHIGKKSGLIQNMSVSKNIFLTDNRYYRHGFIREAAMRRSAQAVLKERAALAFTAWTRVRDLTDAAKYMLELEKARILGAQVLVVDDISDAYSGQDMENIRANILGLNQSGIAIVYLTNKYSALVDIMDRVCFVHSGMVTKNMPRQEISQESFLTHLIPNYASPSGSLQRQPAPRQGPVVLSAQNVSVPGTPLQNLCFNLHKGEVLGIWDIDQGLNRLLVNTLLGTQPYEGDFQIKGQVTQFHKKKPATRSGVAILSSQQYKQEIVTNISVVDNVTLMAHNKIYSMLGFKKKRMQQHIAQYATELIGAEYLLQKYRKWDSLYRADNCDLFRIIVARWLCLSPEIFIFVNPYNNFDDVTINDFNQVIASLNRLGISIIIISMNRRYLGDACSFIISAE